MSKAKITIQDTTNLPTVYFEPAEYVVKENARRIEVIVKLSGPSAKAVTVRYQTTNISAQAGLDYLETSGTLTFAPGEVQKSILISILEDEEIEPDETFQIELTNAIGATVGEPPQPLPEPGPLPPPIPEPEQLPVPANAKYVSTQGSDSDLGTPARPWRTVQHAVNQAAAGDTIVIRGGVYNESIKLSRSGQEGKPITLRTYPGEMVLINGVNDAAIADYTGCRYWDIDGPKLDSNVQWTLSQDAWANSGYGGGSHYWSVRNCQIIGAVRIHGSYNTVKNNVIDGSLHKGDENGLNELFPVSHHNIFRGNEVHHFNARGIWSQNRTHDSIFENNYVHHIGDATEGMGIDTDGWGNVAWRHVIRGNHIHNCGETGIELENTFDSLVANNIIHDIGRRGLNVINYGPDVYPGGGQKQCTVGGESNQYGDTDGNGSCEGNPTKNVIAQNLLYRTGQWGAIVAYHAGGVRVLSNTVCGGRGPAFVLNRGMNFCPQIELRGNIFANNASEEVQIISPDSLVLDSHNLFYHPAAGKAYAIGGAYMTLAEYQAATGKGQNSREGNPQFIDIGQDDYRLAAPSPAVNASLDLGFSQDIAGVARPQSAGYDMGAWERLT